MNTASITIQVKPTPTFFTNTYRQQSEIIGKESYMCVSKKYSSSSKFPWSHSSQWFLYLPWRAPWHAHNWSQMFPHAPSEPYRNSNELYCARMKSQESGFLPLHPFFPLWSNQAAGGVSLLSSSPRFGEVEGSPNRRGSTPSFYHISKEIKYLYIDRFCESQQQSDNLKPFGKLMDTLWNNQAAIKTCRTKTFSQIQDHRRES